MCIPSSKCARVTTGRKERQPIGSEHLDVVARLGPQWVGSRTCRPTCSRAGRPIPSVPVLTPWRVTWRGGAWSTDQLHQQRPWSLVETFVGADLSTAVGLTVVRCAILRWRRTGREGLACRRRRGRPPAAGTLITGLRPTSARCRDHHDVGGTFRVDRLLGWVSVTVAVTVVRREHRGSGATTAGRRKAASFSSDRLMDEDVLTVANHRRRSAAECRHLDLPVGVLDPVAPRPVCSDPGERRAGYALRLPRRRPACNWRNLVGVRSDVGIRRGPAGGGAGTVAGHHKPRAEDAGAR